MTNKTKDLVMFLFGLAGFSYNTILEDNPRPIIVGACLAMMLGAPAISALIRKWGGPGE